MKRISALLVLTFICNLIYAQITFDNVPPLSGGGNTGGGAGYAFNFTTNQDIIIQNFRASLSAVSGTATIYYNPNKITGAPGSTADITLANGWIDLGSVNMTGLTSTSSSPVLETIPIPLNLSLNANDTIGVILYWSANVYPTTNTTTPTFSDGTVTIIADATCAYTFNGAGSYTPRQVNGGVIYNLAAACSGTPVAGTANGPSSSVCANEDFTLTLSGNTAAADLSYQWLSSPSAAGPWTPLAGATSYSLDTSQVADTLYYACEVTCTNSSLSDTSIAVMVTTDPNLAAGTYTIGATGDYPTFAAAIAAMSCGIGGPVVFNVQPGVYPESVQLTEIINASAANTVTFDGADSSLVTLTYDGANGTSGSDYAVVYMNGADYVTFKNMTIRHTGTSFDEWGFLFSNSANYNTVEACVIEVNPAGTSDVMGILFSGSETTDLTEADNGNYNTIIGNTIKGGEQNVHLEGGSTGNPTVGNKFINNYLFGADDYGIYADEQDSLWIIGNTIRGLRTASLADGIYIFDQNNYMVVGNDVIAPDYGIYINDGNDGYTPVVPSLVANNMVISETDYAVYLNDVETTDFIHNSVQGNPGLGLNDVEIGLRVVNNILTSWDGFAVDYADVNPLDSVDYNIYYTPPTNPNFIEIGTSSFVDLVDFQTNVPGYNTYSLEGDPVFVSPTSDLHVLGSLADSAAAPSLVFLDIDGEARNSLFPDIGADEFELFNNDAGVTDLPTTSICPGNSDISITLLNYGSQDLNSVQVFWTVNGAFQAPFNFGGTLPSSDDTTFVIGTFNFSGGSQTYDIVVWTQTPNGLTDQDFSNDTLSLTGLRTALSGNYSIDTSGSGDFLSFNDAVSALNSYGVCGPVVITADTGVYLESVQLTEITGASAINTVTFDGVDSTLVTLEYDGTAGSSGSNYAVVYMNGVDYVTFKNMTVRHSGTGTDEWGFLFSNSANYNTVEACVIEVNPAGISDVMGVLFSGSETTDLTEADNGNYNTIRGNTIKGGEQNVHLEGGSTGNPTVGNTFINNYLFGADDYGIYADEQDSLWIIGNTIRGLRTASLADGIYLFDQNNFMIVGNDVIAPDWAIYLNDGNDAYTPVAPSLIANNMVISETDYAVYLNDVESADYFHNTTLGDPGLGLNDVETAVRVVNNIMGSLTGFALDYADINPLDSLDYNIYYTPVSNTNFVEIGTSSFVDLADLQANLPGNYNTHSLEGDPVFISETDNLHVLAPLADSTATPVGVLEDIDGEVRNTSFPDIGADEFEVLNRDIGIVDIPASSICPGVSDVSVTMLNFGLRDITSAQIFWTVNGAIQAPFSFGGTLGSLQDTTFVIGSYNFGGFSQIYDIEVWTTLPNGNVDQQMSNDTLLLTNVRTGLDGTYVIDTTGVGDFLTFNEAVTALNQYGVCGPVVITAAPDVYYESVQLHEITGASDINTITFDGVDSALVTLTYDGAGGSGSNYAVVYMNGADYVTFKNMTVKHTGTGTDEWGFLFSNAANYNTVEACKIEVNPSGTTDVAGVVFSGSETSDITEENNGNYNTILGNKITGGEKNIHVEGDFGAMNVGNKIINNYLFGADDYGIYSDEQDSLWIIGNTIRGLRASTTAEGIYLIDQNNYMIVGNDIIAPDWAVYLTDGNDGYTPAVPSLIANNMVLSETDYAVYLNDAESTDYFHNTTLGDPGLGLNDVETGVRVVNNIMASLTGFAMDYADINPLDSLDYNIYYTPASNTDFVEIGTSSFVDLADLQANLPGNYNTNSLEGDPIFVSVSSDLHVLGPLADSSATLLGFTEDIDGDARNTSFPDIGADEFDVRQVDIALLEVMEQPMDDCDIYSDTLVVLVGGFGVQPQSNIEVYYSVNGATPVLGGTGTASVGIGEYDTVTVTGIDFTQDGIYNIDLFVTVVNDEDLSNDTISTTVENLAIPDLIVDNVSVVCDSGTATIDVSTTAGLVNWYLENDTSFAVYDTGMSIVTPFLTASDTLYAELIDEQFGSIGPVDNSIGSSADVWSVNYGLYFDVFVQTRIVSVDVFPTGLGNMEFILEDNGGNTVASTIVAITGGSTTTPFTAVLNFTVPPGTGYVLRPGSAFTTPHSIRNSTGGNYPYTLPGVISITGNLFNNGPGPYYYYFYNWQVVVPGCNSDLIPVPVPVYPSPVVDLGADSEVCQGTAVVLDAGNAGSTYLWSDSSDSQTLSVTSTGDVSVTVTTPSTCTASDTVSVTVNSLPSVNIGNDTTVCDTAWVIFDAGAGFDSYHWTLNGELVGNTQMITVEDPGTYYVVVESDKACFNTDSATLSIESCIGIEGYFAENAISIYPNPNEGQFKLSVDMEKSTKARFSLIDLSGKVVYQEDLTLNQGSTYREFDFDHLSTGVYLVKLTTDKDHHVERLVIE